MEEAAVLSNRVGILANRMLALGSTEVLIAEHGTYEVVILWNASLFVLTPY
jgi:hypothetical protein